MTAAQLVVITKAENQPGYSQEITDALAAIAERKVKHKELNLLDFTGGK